MQQRSGEKDAVHRDGTADFGVEKLQGGSFALKSILLIYKMRCYNEGKAGEKERKKDARRRGEVTICLQRNLCRRWSTDLKCR